MIRTHVYVSMHARDHKISEKMADRDSSMTDEEVKRRYKGGGTADENKEIVHEEHDHEVDDVFNDLLLDSYPQGS